MKKKQFLFLVFIFGIIYFSICVYVYRFLDASISQSNDDDFDIGVSANKWNFMISTNFYGCIFYI